MITLADACSTKAKRQALAARVAELANFYPGRVTVKIRDLGPDETIAVLSIGEYRVSVGFDKIQKKIGAFLAHWNTTPFATVKYPVEFAVVGDVNPYHRAKATTCVGNVDLLLVLLRKGIDILLSPK